MHRRQTELYHYGVKGMKWGIRRTPAQLGHKIGKAAKSAGRGIKNAVGKAAESRKAKREAKKQADRIIAEARAEAERDNERLLHDSQDAMKELVAAATERLMMKNDDKAIDLFLDSVEKKQKKEQEAGA